MNISIVKNQTYHKNNLVLNNKSFCGKCVLSSYNESIPNSVNISSYKDEIKEIKKHLKEITTKTVSVLTNAKNCKTHAGQLYKEMSSYIEQGKKNSYSPFQDKSAKVLIKFTPATLSKTDSYYLNIYKENKIIKQSFFVKNKPVFIDEINSNSSIDRYFFDGKILDKCYKNYLETANSDIFADEYYLFKDNNLDEYLENYKEYSSGKIVSLNKLKYNNQNLIEYYQNYNDNLTQQSATKRIIFMDNNPSFADLDYQKISGRGYNSKIRFIFENDKICQILKDYIFNPLAGKKVNILL